MQPAETIEANNAIAIGQMFIILYKNYLFYGHKFCNLRRRFAGMLVWK